MQSFYVIRERAAEIARRVSRSFVGWRSDEDDLCQEALLRMYSVVGDVSMEFQNRSRQEQAAYLNMIANSACIDHLRRLGRHRTGRVDVDAVPACVAHNSTPAAEFDASEMRQELKDVVAESRAMMSLREQQAFAWKFGGGAPLEGVSKWTIRTYVDRALCKFRTVASRKQVGWLVERL